MKRLVAMTGLSGVGKTTFLTALQTRIPFQHLQAGNLIKSAREVKSSASVGHDELKNLNLDENQRLLVQAFHATSDRATLVILDGHTVIERDGRPSLVPVDVFAALEIEAMFVLVDSPEKIAARRIADLSRNRPRLAVTEINHRQEMATEHAKTVARILNIPFRQVTSSSADTCHHLLSSAVWDDIG